MISRLQPIFKNFPLYAAWLILLDVSAVDLLHLEKPGLLYCRVALLALLLFAAFDLRKTMLAILGLAVLHDLALQTGQMLFSTYPASILLLVYTGSHYFEKYKERRKERATEG
jgi:hypothetical protein